MKRMAFGQTQRGKSAAFYYSIFGERCFGVLGTAGREAAMRAQKGRYTALVDGNGRDDGLSDNDLQSEFCLPPSFSFPPGGRLWDGGNYFIARSVFFCLFFFCGLIPCGPRGWPFFSGNRGCSSFSACWAEMSFSSRGPCYKLFLNNGFIIQTPLKYIFILCFVNSFFAYVFF
jgi:hypothetical protein